MAVAPAGAAARFVKDAIQQAGTAEGLARRIETLVGRRYKPQTITAWARGADRVNGPALFAIAEAMGMSLDSYLQPTAGGPLTIQQQLDRLAGRQGELIEVLGLEDAISDDGRPATMGVGNVLARLVELERRVEELERDRQAEREGRGA